MSRGRALTLAVAAAAGIALALGLGVVISAPDTALPWSVISSAGVTESSSTSYRIGATVGQPGPGGSAGSVSYTLGAGSWNGVFIDADGDTLEDPADNCPGEPNPGQLNTDKDNETLQFRLGTGSPPPIVAGDPQGDACDTDDDNDLFSDADERKIFGVAVGSAEERFPCPTGTVVDSWPPDVFPAGTPNNLVNINDLVAVLGFFGQSFGDGGYLVRFDIFQPGTTININDLVAVLGFFGQSCQEPP